MSKDLNEYSLDELQKEIENRKKKESMPKRIENPDFQFVIIACESVVQSIADGTYRNKDTAQYMFEDTMKAVYGKDIFKWINKNTQ